MQEENRKIIKEAKDLMEKWRGFDDNELPDVVRETRELLRDFYDTQGKNPKEDDQFNTRLKLDEEGEELLTDIAWRFKEDEYSDFSFYHKFYDTNSDFRDRYNIHDVNDWIEFINKINRFKDDRFLREILSSDQIIELYSEGTNKGLSMDEIDRIIYIEYSGSGNTFNDLYNQIWSAIQSYDERKEEWNF